MNQSFFIDSIENIALAEGVIRMDCVVIEPGPENKPVGRRAASLAMPLSGFLRSADRFNQVMGKLVEQGVLKKQRMRLLWPLRSPQRLRCRLRARNKRRSGPLPSRCQCSGFFYLG